MVVAKDVFESEAIRRAVEGVVTESVTRNGTVVRTVTHSDTLLLRLLERMESGSWTRRQNVEVNTCMTFPTAEARRKALEAARESKRKSDAIETAAPMHKSAENGGVAVPSSGVSDWPKRL